MTWRRLTPRHFPLTFVRLGKINPPAVAPALKKTRTAASVAIAKSLEPSLARLVELRASQING